MPWYVQYRRDAVEHIERYPSPETAIEAACTLIHGNNEVFGIGMGPFTDSIESGKIAEIYDLWVRSKYPFGVLPHS
jgi:hypothetical protein